MKCRMKGEIEELKWEDARKDILKHNKALCDTIDKLNLTKKHTMIRVRYPYGAKILDEGQFCVPGSDGTIVPISSSSVSDSVKNNLTYRSIPAGVITHNAAETFYTMEDRIVTLGFFKPGYVLGLWEFLDPLTSHMMNIWSITAGARSIFMVPKITDVESYTFLQKAYDVPRKLSRELVDHWDIFKSIANHPSSENKWYFEIIFLTKAWHESFENKEKGWEKLENFFLGNGWRQSSYWKNKVTYDILWEKFINELAQDYSKPNSHDIYTVKHLWLVALGAFPGLMPTDSDLTAPTQFLQDVFVKCYGLKFYVPTLMVPGHFSPQEKNYVYYSLQFPTLLESSPKSKHYPSLISNLKELKNINEKFVDESLNGKLRIENSLIHEAIKNVKMDYFHSEADGSEGIQNSELMAKEDEKLLFCANKMDKMRFSDKSRFVKGCIRISAK